MKLGTVITWLGIVERFLRSEVNRILGQYKVEANDWKQLMQDVLDIIGVRTNLKPNNLIASE